MPFDAQAAKTAGYSDGEIADYLGGQARFDVGAARQAGYSDAEIIGHLSGAGPLQEKAAPPQRSLTQDVTGFMANVNRGLGVGDEMAAGLKTAGNVFSGKTPIQDVGPDFQRSMADQRATEDSFANAHPHIAALAKGSGMAATAAIPAGETANVFAAGTRGLNAATAMNMARGATTAGLQGAAYAAADRGSLRERALGAAAAARDPATLALGAVGGALATPKGASPVRAAPAVDPNVKLLASEGVQMTPGQMRGGMAKTVEDVATSLPIVGPAIQDARTNSLQSFNKAVVNRALKPLGETLPSDLGAGSEAVKYAGDKLSAAYEKVLPEIGVRPDKQFAADAAKITPIAETMSESAQNTLQSIIEKRVTSLSKADGGVLSGDRFKQVEKGLNYEIDRFAGSSDPDHQAINQALGIMKDAVQSAAMRQNPGFAAAKSKIDQGWAELTRVETAAGKAGADGGVFTPAQYQAAVRSGDNRIRNRGVARGEAFGQDIATAGKAVLPSKVPDSGTAGRAAVMHVAVQAPAAVIGGLTGGGWGAAAGMAGTTAGLGAASRLYSPKAIAAANVALNERINRPARDAALAEITALAAKDPKYRALAAQVAAKVSRAAGIAGGSRAGNVFAQPGNP